MDVFYKKKLPTGSGKMEHSPPELDAMSFRITVTPKTWTMAVVSEIQYTVLVFK